MFRECGDCEGRGKLAITCTKCDGTCRVPNGYLRGRCPTCEGCGTEYMNCEFCGGTGELS